MKIAVCWAGQPRTVSHTWPDAHAKLFQNLGDYDLFIHSSQQYPVPSGFWETLKPKAYMVEAQHPFPDLEAKHRDAYFHPPILGNYLQQTFGWKRACHLKDLHQSEHGTKYDLVIKARPDIQYLRPITPDMFDRTKLNAVPRILDPGRTQCPTDHFFAGPDHLMAKLFTVFDWLQVNDLEANGHWTLRLPPENVAAIAGRHCPETVLASYLEAAGVPVRFTDWCFEDVMAIRRD